jgi:adenosylmethionine-8-amino-7-oxononanoate aminotransferase
VSRSPHLHSFAPPAAEPGYFLTIERAEGSTVWDSDGRAYIDAMASLWYCTVGHGRPEIIDAVADQLRRLDAFHTLDIFTNPPAEAFAALVSDRMPVPGSRVLLTSSGSESVDSALKLARVRSSLRGEPERQLVIGRRHAYHGVTYGGLSVQGLPANQENFGPLLDRTHRLGAEGAEELAEVEALFAARGPEVAAVITEPVQGAGGVRPPVPGYLERLRELCDEHGALLIFDEVITGFGRLGAWSAAEVFGVVPDLVTFAKGCSSGYQPLGGVVVGRAVLDVMEDDPSFVLRHGFTYSGHPAACAAGIANVEVLEREGLFDEVPRIARRLGGGLAALADDGVLAGHRGMGGMWAALLPEGVAPTAVRAGMLARGVIARPIGADVIAFCPPLVITDDELDRCLHALADSVAAVAA